MNPKDFKHTPKFIGIVLWGMIYYTLLEAEMFLLAIVGGLWAWQLGWEWGLTIYLSAYFVWRLIGNNVSAVVRAMNSPKTYRPSAPVMGEHVNE